MDGLERTEHKQNLQESVEPHTDGQQQRRSRAAMKLVLVPDEDNPIPEMTW